MLKCGLIATTVLVSMTCLRAQMPDGLRTGVVVEDDVAVTSPQGAHLNWYEAKADPEDNNHIIVCGAARDAQNNSYYGVVFASQDGGKSWRRALEDRSSTWVSEQSCAFGPSHTAYFVSEASLVRDGQLSHSSGTTRIFVSQDGGENWKETANTGWADYSTSVVSKTPADGSRLYVFYNGNSLYDEDNRRGSTLEFFTVADMGTRVGERLVVPRMAEREYRGVYPSSSVVLKNGTPVVLFNARRKGTDRDADVLMDIGVVRAERPLVPVIIATRVSREDRPACPFNISPSLAYDSIRDVLFVAYNDMVSQTCVVMLASSRDGGLTWTSPHLLAPSDETTSSMYFPILAVNHEGILGLMWRGRPEKSPDCWFFSSSHDQTRLENTVLLSPCIGDGSLAAQSSAYLTTVIEQPQEGRPANVELLTFRDYLTRVGITVTADGFFHPVWSTLGDGQGELRTAAVHFEMREFAPKERETRRLAMTDMTDRVTVLFGGYQRLDHTSHSVAVELEIKNKSAIPIRGPLYLEVQALRSDFGRLALLNSPSVPGLLPLTSTKGRELLQPGEVDHCLLRFRLDQENFLLSNRYFLLQMKLRIYGDLKGQADE